MGQVFIQSRIPQNQFDFNFLVKGLGRFGDDPHPYPIPSVVCKMEGNEASKILWRSNVMRGAPKRENS